MVKGVQRLRHMEEEDGPKIFVIGLNRCGTTSFHTLFEKSFIPSLHWRDSGKVNLTQAMMTNLALGLKPFEGFDGYVAFSDLSYISTEVVLEGARLFREIHRHYPDAYFILNTRPIESWIASRTNHFNGLFLNQTVAASGYNKAEVHELWRDLAQNHEDEVKAYFAGNPKFLHFDITTGDPQEIADLLDDDYAIDITKWEQSNRGPGARPAPALRSHSDTDIGNTQAHLHRSE